MRCATLWERRADEARACMHNRSSNLFAEPPGSTVTIVLLSLLLVVEIVMVLFKP